MWIGLIIDTTQRSADAAVFCAVTGSTQHDTLARLEAVFVDAWTEQDPEADSDLVWSTMVSDIDEYDGTTDFVYRVMQSSNPA